MDKFNFSKIGDKNAPAWVFSLLTIPGVTVKVRETTIEIARTLDGPAPPAPAHQGGPVLVWVVDWSYGTWVNALSGAPVGIADQPNSDPAYEILAAVAGYRPLLELC